MTHSIHQYIIISSILLSIVSCTRSESVQTEPGLIHANAQEIAQEAWSKSSSTIEANLTRPVTGLTGINIVFQDSIIGNEVKCYFNQSSDGVFRSTSWLPETSIGPAYGVWPQANEERQEYPFGEHLVFTENKRSESNNEIQNILLDVNSSMALLQIELRTDSIPDIVNSLSISSPQLPISGIYDSKTGKWGDLTLGGKLPSTRPSCPMASPITHDFFLPPTPESIDINLALSINDRLSTFNIVLPPLPAGSLTKLRLDKKQGKVMVNGSWVASQHPLRCESSNKIQELSDSIKVGWFLRQDGLCVASADSLCIAIVVETDGFHGRAAALYDSCDEALWGEAALLPLPTYVTIDGLKTDGVLNTLSELLEEERIIYTPRMKYPLQSALYQHDGATATSIMLRQLKQTGELEFGEKHMLAYVSSHPCSYIPSLRELAHLHYLLSPASPTPLLGLDSPEGFCISCTPSSEKCYYAIDFRDGTIVSNMSKALAKNHLRLFYVF